MKSVKDVEEAFHAQMCKAAEEQCGMGDAKACRTAKSLELKSETIDALPIIITSSTC
ncbi:hypothetical protein KAS08_05165 [Candidatus Pacearchaeota archaeon]|nr:hypothetical protein [Candidatus Pacearchaeota archaeon]